MQTLRFMLKESNDNMLHQQHTKYFDDETKIVAIVTSAGRVDIFNGQNARKEFVFAGSDRATVELVANALLRIAAKIPKVKKLAVKSHEKKN